MARKTLSVIVPAFNEEEYIEQCLSALLLNAEWIDEVIVVDNNSTDNTRHLAGRFQGRLPGLVVVNESTPGVAHARNAGFARANSDIIARVDADTIVDPAWAQSIHECFGNAPEYSAVTGVSYLYESPVASVQRKLSDALSANWRKRGSRPVMMLSGANMALHRDTWLSIRDHATTSADLHEDVDLSLCLLKKNFRLGQCAGMTMQLSGRRGNTPLRGYWSYTQATRRTFSYHGINYLGLRVLLAANFALHVALLPLYRGHSLISGGRRSRGATQRTLPIGDRPVTQL